MFLSLSKNHKIFNFIYIVFILLIFFCIMKLYLLIKKGIGIVCRFLLIKLMKPYAIGNWIRPLLQVSWFPVRKCMSVPSRNVYAPVTEMFYYFFTFDKTFGWSHFILKKERKPKHSSGETFLYEKLNAWISSIWHEITDTDVNKHTDNINC